MAIDRKCDFTVSTNHFQIMNHHTHQVLYNVNILSQVVIFLKHFSYNSHLLIYMHCHYKSKHVLFYKEDKLWFDYTNTSTFTIFLLPSQLWLLLWSPSQ